MPEPAIKSNETEQQAHERENNFGRYKHLNGLQMPRIHIIRTKMNELSKTLNESCPASRELSIAQTKLQECLLFAEAAISNNEYH